MNFPVRISLFAIGLGAAPFLALAAHNEDHRIEQAAKESYVYREVLRDDDIKVKSEAGVVTLTGTVSEADRKKLAEDTVRGLPGVVQVDNRLVVKTPANERSDDWIAVKVRGMLLMKPNVSATQTKVAVQDGVVTLTGTADNVAQKELTEAYVKDIEGVRSVRNDLVVAPPSAQSSSERTFGEVVDDASITAQVKYALLKHRSTSALKTEVTTREGVVTLEGEATSEAEKDLATKLAKDVRGVRTVQNEMVIRR